MTLVGGQCAGLLQIKRALRNLMLPDRSKITVNHPTMPCDADVQSDVWMLWIASGIKWICQAFSWGILHAFCTLRFVGFTSRTSERTEQYISICTWTMICSLVLQTLYLVWKWTFVIALLRIKSGPTDERLPFGNFSFLYVFTVGMKQPADSL